MHPFSHKNILLVMTMLAKYDMKRETEKHTFFCQYHDNEYSVHFHSLRQKACVHHHDMKSNNPENNTSPYHCPHKYIFMKNKVSLITLEI